MIIYYYRDYTEWMKYGFENTNVRFETITKLKKF